MCRLKARLNGVAGDEGLGQAYLVNKTELGRTGPPGSGRVETRSAPGVAGVEGTEGNGFS